MSDTEVTKFYKCCLCGLDSPCIVTCKPGVDIHPTQCLFTTIPSFAEWVELKETN